MRSYIRPFVIALALVAGCARGARPAADANAAPAASEPRFSLYDLDARWHDQRGATRTLASLAGRPVVLAMIYTNCGSTCPLTIGEMKQIEHATGPNVALVLVSLDPERDSASRLGEYAEHTQLAPERWTLLSGSDDDTRALAAALGVRYRRVSATELAHSNTLTLLDATGAIVQQEIGLGGGAAILGALHAMATTLPAD